MAHTKTRRGPSGVLVALLCLIVSARPAAAQQRDSVRRTDASPECGACGTGPRIGLTTIHAVAAQDTGRRRAIEYSGAYSTVMTIHRIGSYLELPLFVSEYFVGQKLLNDERKSPTGRSNLKGPHGAIAAGLGVLFSVNTVTGVWGLVESRHDPAGRTRRWIHAITMLVADGGFLATAGAAESARETSTEANRHRALAIGSMGLAMVSTAIMWFWKD